MSPETILPRPGMSPQYSFVVHGFLPGLMALTGGWKVSGREHVSLQGSVLVCPNHISYLDPPVVGAALETRRCCFMAKAALFRIPLLGNFLRSSYCYPVDRKGGGRQAIRMATDLLNAGEVVVMFPEGTRSPTGELMKGEPGAVYVASKAKTPIVPVAVWGTDLVMRRHSYVLHRAPVWIRFGPAMHLPEPADGERLTRVEIDAVTDELMRRIAELGREIEAEVPERWLRAHAKHVAYRNAHLSPAETEVVLTQTYKELRGEEPI